jgi:DNA anti-recombination protein RmuC
MMKNVRYMVALSVLAAAPLAAQQSPRPGAEGQPGRRWEQGPGHERRAPFQRLIEHRQQLELTDAQVARLQAIGARLEEQNRPLVAQLQQQRERFMEQRRAQMEKLSPEQRRDTLRALRTAGRRREIPDAMRPPMEQMRRNIHAAREEVQGVLTPQQKERARELMREGRRGEGRRGGMKGGHRGRGAHGDTTRARS